MPRPENSGPPDLFYSEEEAKKYTSNSHIIAVQQQLSERAIELLALPDDQPSFLLDIGCGSGLSGEVLSEMGHYWTGLDISSAMLEVAREEREVEGDLLLGDMGQGIPFVPGSFDGAISISAIQWLCNADSKDKNPVKRLLRFFTSLYASLSRGSRAVFQFYPENPAQVNLITQQAMKAGFRGGVVVDYPQSTRAKKLYLVLFTGGSVVLPKALGTEPSETEVSYSATRQRERVMRGAKPPKGSREWILSKKERARRVGKEVKADTKYTGRKRRKTRF